MVPVEEEVLSEAVDEEVVDEATDIQETSNRSTLTFPTPNSGKKTSNVDNVDSTESEAKTTPPKNATSSKLWWKKAPSH